MSRVPRTALPDGYFHVSCRGLAGAPAFPTPSDRSAFFSLLPTFERRHHLVLWTAVTLTTHYHLVVEATRASLSRGLQWLNWRYARAFNKRHDLFGHVFAERFSARVIADEGYLYDACAYVLDNPVRAGLCDRAEDWPWAYSRFAREVA